MQGEEALTDILTAIRALGKAAENYALAKEPTARGNVVSRVVILSDAHIGETLTHAGDKLESTLGQLIDMGGSDAILFTGDFTNNGIDSEYEEFLRIIQDETLSAASDRMAIVLGNHEHYRGGYKTSANTEEEKAAVTEAFNKYITPLHTAELGFTTANNGLDHTMVINGTYFIGLGERDCVGLYGSEVESYLRGQVAAAAAADPTKPIFVYSHIGYGAIEGSSKMSVSAETQAFLKDYPQVIWITGHTHYASQEPQMIQQGDFTNIQAPTHGSKQWWVYSAGYDHPASYAYEVQQGIIIEVTDTNVVTAQRYDFGTGDPIGQEWVIDIPAILRSTDNFTYTLEERLAQAEAPVWKNTDEITASEVIDTSITVKIPRAHIEDAVSDDVVEYYRLIVLDPDDNIVYSKRYLGEYYRGTKQAEQYTFTVSGLAPETEYRFIAVAESIWGKVSKGLEARITTAEKIIPTLDNLTTLLDVDYTSGSTADACGNEMIIDKVDGDASLNSPGEGYPILTEDGIVFDNSYGLGYAIGDEKALLVNTLTIETVVTPTDEAYDNNAWGWVGVISNEESGGFGINYNYKYGSYSNNLLSFIVNLVDADGNRLEVKLTAAVDEGTQVHVVATFNGRTAPLYINGEAVATQTVAEGYSIRHTTATDMLYVGANAWSNNSGQCPLNGVVEYVTLYQQGVSDGQAALMYENYVNPPAEDVAA